MSGYHSKHEKTKDKEEIHNFIGLDGRPTNEPPHVHQIFDETNSRVVLLGTTRDRRHFGRVQLESPDATQVQQETSRLLENLNRDYAERQKKRERER